MWKERIVIICFGVLLAWLGGGAMHIAQEAVWLRLFGVETPAKVIDLYQQDGDWFVTYQFDVAGATYSGLAPAPRTANIGGAVVIAYLPHSPGVSNTMQEVRAGGDIGYTLSAPVRRHSIGNGHLVGAERRHDIVGETAHREQQRRPLSHAIVPSG